VKRYGQNVSLKLKLKKGGKIMIAVDENRKQTMLQSKLANDLMNRLSKGKDSPDVMISLYMVVFKAKFDNYLLSISPSLDTEFKEISAHSSINKKLLKFLTSTELALTDAFAEAKYLLDRLFLESTNKGTIKYLYQKKQFLTPQELEREIGVSRTTVYRYAKRGGLEVLETSSKKRFPRHVTYYWQDGKMKGLWLTKLEALEQIYKTRNRSENQTIYDLQKEIERLERKYGGTFEEVSKAIKHPDELDNPFDYVIWENAIKDLNKRNDE
jgi:predicted DNA-binding transcriptional regulator AlpA